MLSSGGPSHW